MYFLLRTTFEETIKVPSRTFLIYLSPSCFCIAGIHQRLDQKSSLLMLTFQYQRYWLITQCFQIKLLSTSRLSQSFRITLHQNNSLRKYTIFCQFWINFLMLDTWPNDQPTPLIQLFYDDPTSNFRKDPHTHFTYFCESLFILWCIIILLISNFLFVTS